jgi:hypothetical protein
MNHAAEWLNSSTAFPALNKVQVEVPETTLNVSKWSFRFCVGIVAVSHEGPQQGRFDGAAVGRVASLANGRPVQLVR